MIQGNKAQRPSREKRSIALGLLTTLLVGAAGCTTQLWDHETFVHAYRAAGSTNVHLYFSNERRDVLVQYEESKDGEAKTRPRCYWVEPNLGRLNNNRKPRFVSAKTADSLTPIPLSQDVRPANGGPAQLIAVANRDDDYISLYSGDERISAVKLPVYSADGQRLKQVLLTPFALAVDATIVGAFASIYMVPQILANGSR